MKNMALTKNSLPYSQKLYANLMYGFPTQTEQESIDSLEVVRQLFESNCIQSAFLFTTTVISPIGKNPQEFGINITDLYLKDLFKTIYTF